MKKTLISTAITAALGFAMFGPMVASAEDGIITFTGEIIDTTCTVIGGGAAIGEGDIIVKLPPVRITALPEGQSAGDTKFSLTLSGEKCTDGKTAALWIETAQTPALDSATGALRNLQSTGATNVEVRLINPATNLPIDLGINDYVAHGSSSISPSNQPAAEITGGTATLNYVAQYLAVGGDATAGLVSTYLTYSMQYN